jgi:hypothetical protein
MRVQPIQLAPSEFANDIRARDGTPEARFFPLARSIRGPDKAFIGAVQCYNSSVSGSIDTEFLVRIYVEGVEDAVRAQPAACVRPAA